MLLHILSPSWGEKQKKYVWVLQGKHTPRVDIEQIRSRLLGIRQHSAASVDHLATELMKRAKDDFREVIYARDSEEAVRFITTVANDTSILSVNRSSTVKELITGLEDEGFDVIHSYGQEYDASKCQTFEEVMALPPELLWQSFNVEAYRIQADNTFKDYTGVLGVNAMSVDGSVFFLQHFSNISHVLDEAKRIVLVVGLEKLVESREDAEFQTRCMGIFGLNSILQELGDSQIQHPTGRTSISELQPTKEEREIYLILLDNGRKEILNSTFSNLFYCINCRACTKSCPAYPNFQGEFLRSPKEYITDFLKGVESSISDCIQCGQCSITCPLIELDQLMLDAKAEYVRKRGLNIRDRLFINLILLAGIGSTVAPIINVVINNALVRKAAEKILGIESSTAFPTLSAKPFFKRHKKRAKVGKR